MSQSTARITFTASLLIAIFLPSHAFSQVGGFTDYEEILAHYGEFAEEIQPGVIQVRNGTQTRVYGFGSHAMRYAAEQLRHQILAARQTEDKHSRESSGLAGAEKAYWMLSAHLDKVESADEGIRENSAGLAGVSSDSGLICQWYGWGLPYTLDVYAEPGGSNFWGVHASAEASGNTWVAGPFPEFDIDMHLYAQTSYTAWGQTFWNSDNLYIPQLSMGTLGPVTIDSGYAGGQASATAMAWAWNQYCAAHGHTNDFVMISEFVEW